MVEQNTSRGHWGSQAEFILVCLGYAVGLGNVWRFPYLCGRSGGAAFLIPYLIMMVFAGFPLFYMELAIGQFSQTNPTILFARMAPIATGLGYCMIMAQIYLGMYYNMVIAWALYYLVNTFRSPLQWSHCTNAFNTFRCYDDVLYELCQKGNQTYYEGKCCTVDDLLFIQGRIDQNWRKAVDEKYTNASLAVEYRDNFTARAATAQFQKPETILHSSGLETSLFRKVEETLNLTGRRSPTEEFLNLRMLRLSDGIEPQYYGTPQWELVLCLLAAWVLVFLCLLGGTKTSGKVVYFTATFPYLILTILLIRGLSLGDGVMDGLMFFLVPDVSKLSEAKVWGDAAMQIFFSLSLGLGGLTTIASYNRFHNNFFRDTLIVVLGNCATSIYAGLAIFPMVGYIAHGLQKNVSAVAEEGVALAFQVYPHAINRMAVPQLWAFLFFFMLVLLGIDSQLVVVETPLTALTDRFPALRAPVRKMAVTAVFCFVGFLLGLVFTCPGGPYLITLIDTYGVGWPTVISGTLEILVVMHIYGYKNFIADVRLMLGEPPSEFYRVLGYPVNPYWIVNWVVITPSLLVGILVFNIVKFQRTTSGSYTYPIKYDVLGGALSVSCVALVPALALYYCTKYRKSREYPGNLFKPTKDWGPAESNANAWKEVTIDRSNNKVFTCSSH